MLQREVKDATLTKTRNVTENNSKNAWHTKNKKMRLRKAELNDGQDYAYH